MTPKTTWIFSLIAALATAIMMQTQGAGLKTDLTPLGIVSLELAASLGRVQQILSTWNHQELVLNIGLDFLFIPAYTFFFIQSLKITISALQLSWLQQVGTKLIAVAYLAAALDVIENILMLSSSMGYYSASSVLATVGIASCKFISIGFILLYLLGSLALTYTRKITTL